MGKTKTTLLAHWLISLFGQLADQAAKAHSWIKAIHKANRGFPVLPAIFSVVNKACIFTR
jgi:hypothetical protein